MKSLLKKLVGQLARHELGWRFSKATVLRLADFLHNERRHFISPPAVDYLAMVRQVFPDLTVRHGPFRGLRYAHAQATGSLLFPKLLGSYERELHEVVEFMSGEPFTTVLDIGCAEGYYAVGLALRLPQAEVYAYDISPEAQRLCAATAAANRVAGRVHVAGSCDPAEMIARLDAARKALVVADCEGYEIELFTPEVVAHAARHTLLIETHDLLNLRISRTLKERFTTTHAIRSIQSVDDVQKVFNYDYPELTGFSLEARRELLSEYRPALMEWLVLTPRGSDAVPGTSPTPAG